MLVVAEKFSQLRFLQLMAVYEQSNLENGSRLELHLSENELLLRAESSFYTYLTECFFKTPGAAYALWEVDEAYVSALRLEPYRDGLLIAALETKPDRRNMGFATELLRAVRDRWQEPLYSHVSKQNGASLALHEKCGFQPIADHACYIDGSVSHHAWTLFAPPRGKIPLDGKNY